MNIHDSSFFRGAFIGALCAVLGGGFVAAQDSTLSDSAFLLPSDPTNCDDLSVVVVRHFDSDCGWSARQQIFREEGSSQIAVVLEPVAETDQCREVEITEVFFIELGSLEPGDYEMIVEWTDIPDDRGAVPFSIERGRCGEGFHQGDVNSDSELNITDAVGVLGFLFSGGALDCQQAADVNASSQIDLSDAVYTLNYLFLGGPAPTPPFGLCTPVSDVGVFSCERPTCSPPGPGRDSVWVARADGCVQCLPCSAPGLDGAVAELDRAGFTVLESDLFAVPVCLACKVCSSGIFYGVRVPNVELEGILKAGWFPWFASALR